MTDENRQPAAQAHDGGAPAAERPMDQAHAADAAGTPASDTAELDPDATLAHRIDWTLWAVIGGAAVMLLALVVILIAT